MTERLPMMVTVIDCARCGETHDVESHKFTKPIDDYNYWGMCPTSGEPILMRIITDSLDQCDLCDDEVVV